MNDEEIKYLKRALQRERAARKEAEKILETKSTELFDSNEALKKVNANLEEEVQRRAQALHLSNDHHRMLFERNPIPMLIYALDSLEILDVNESAIEKYGYSRMEFLRMNIMQMRGKDQLEAFQQHMKNVRNQDVDRHDTHEWKHVLKDGTEIHVEIKAESIDFMGIPSRMVLMNDVTLRKRADEKLRESIRIKEEFLANMSHEIRTPMNAIIGMGELLAKSGLEEQQMQYSSAIQKSAANLLVIINDILDLTKIESGKVELEYEPFVLQDVIQDLITSTRFRAEEKGLLLNLNYDTELHNFYVGDTVRLGQILTNLLGNALKFTEKGEVTLSCKRLESNTEHEKIRFEVEDTGIGISKSQLENIFEAFRQEDATTTRRYGGTGLGLTISKNLVHLLGGDLKVSSEKGKGTRFYFDVALATGTEPQEQSHGKVSLDPAKLKAKKILMAEDNEMNQFYAMTVMSEWELDVTCVETGKKAVEILQEKQFDLILMDMQMPEMGGVEATQKIRQELHKTLPIIALTANAIKGDREKCLAAGMNDYLSKPFDPDQLKEKLLSWLT